MGNVLARSASEEEDGSKFFSFLGIHTMKNKQKNENSAENRSSEMSERNPGTIEDLHRKCREVHPSYFEGLKFMLNRPLNNYFQVGHTMTLGSPAESSYRFSSTYIGSKDPQAADASPLFMSDMDAHGNLNACIIFNALPRVRCKLSAQLASDSSVMSSHLTSDYRGENFTASLMGGNFDLHSGSGILILHYLQAVTNRLALGVEFAYQRSGVMKGGEASALALVSSYTCENYCWGATISATSLHASYMQKYGDYLKTAVELQTNLNARQSVAKFSYQFSTQRGNFNFQGSIDSQGVISGVFEKQLLPLPLVFAISGRLNHRKNHFKLGIGAIVG